MRRISLIVFAILAGFTIFLIHALYNVSPVTVIASRLERQGGRVYVSGELRNASDRPASIDLEVHYFDRGGRAIGQNTVSIDDLAPGTRPFTTPPLTLDGVKDFTLYLNHGRNPYGN